MHMYTKCTCTWHCIIRELFQFHIFLKVTKFCKNLYLWRHQMMCTMEIFLMTCSYQLWMIGSWFTRTCKYQTCNFILRFLNNVKIKTDDFCVYWIRTNFSFILCSISFTNSVFNYEMNSSTKLYTNDFRACWVWLKHFWTAFRLIYLLFTYLPAIYLLATYVIYI